MLTMKTLLDITGLQVLMVIFQDEEKARHAANAVKTAIAIQEKVRSINQDLEGHFQPLAVNIGINSGSALVGATCLP